MYHFRKKVLFALGVLFLSLTVSFGYAAGPDPKDHSFNSQLPKQFNGEMITLTAYGDLPFSAYEVKPEEDTQKAVLLIHEWWGLNEHIKSVADQLAHLGYNALAIDLYSEKVAQNPKEASKLMKKVKGKEAYEKLRSGLIYLKQRSGPQTQIATIGWCFGGGWSLKASLANPQLVSATIIYYGELENDPDVLKKLKGPVLGIFATEDNWITPQWVMTFKTALEQAGVTHEIYSYDADHAFANPSGKRYNQDAYLDAWDKTLTFLRQNLKNRKQ